MPDQAVMREWVRRLRSGDYAQGRNRLRTDDAFCCLGVLCDMAVERGVIAPPAATEGVTPVAVNGQIHPRRETQYEYASAQQWDYSLTVPPGSVQEWAGLSAYDECPEFECSEVCGHALSQDKLISMNDRGRSFAEIADVIEAEWIEPLPTPEYTVPDTPAEITEDAHAHA